MNPGEADNFRTVEMFILAFERGLVRTPWRRKVASRIKELEAENKRLTSELAKKSKAKPKPASDDE